MTEPQEQTRARRITTITAKHRLNGEVEHYRSRDMKASQATVIARFGHHLCRLGWEPEDIKIVGVSTVREDPVTQALRNRMVRPRA